MRPPPSRAHILKGVRKAIRTLKKECGGGPKVAIAFDAALRKAPRSRSSCGRLKKRKRAPAVSKSNLWGSVTR
jgi:hypothetical protein